MIKCSEAEACDLLKKGQAATVSFEFDNWTKRYGLTCEKAYIRTNTKSMLLVLNTLTCLVLLIASDIYGRKALMKVSSIFVVFGILLASLSPDFLMKMVGLGLVSGGEGTFSALFTIYINENSTKETKLRSSLISMCFLAYSLGCIAFNGIAYISTNPNFLGLTTACFLICSVTPSFFSYRETPHFLYKKGKISELFDTLMSIYRTNNGRYGVEETLFIGVENKLLEMFGFKSQITLKTFFKATQVRLSRNRRQGHKSSFGLLRILRSKSLFYHLFTLTLIGGLLYALFYGMSLNIAELGLKDTKMNGMLLGATQAIGYLLVIPFTHRMRRKQWIIIFQFFILTGALLLILLSKQSQSSTVQFEQTITSTFLMATVMSAIFPIFYIYITEVFPTEVRGTANAVILFLSKLIGSSAPLMENYSVSHGMHVLVGCSLLVVVSLPMSLWMRETLSAKP